MNKIYPNRAVSKIAIILLIFFMLTPVCFEIPNVSALQWKEYGDTNWFKAGHNWVVLNAIELLKRDGRNAEASEMEKYLEDVINGVSDADIGSAGHGARYGISSRNQIDMQDVFNTGYDWGGLSHFFDPWTHKGVGVTEDLGKIYTTANVAVSSVPSIVVGPQQLTLALTSVVADRINEWRNWFGENAAEAAGKAFNRAVNSWENGDYNAAMYYLGYVMHLIGDFSVPHHAAAIFLDGHSEYEEKVGNDLSARLPGNRQAAMIANTEYNLGNNDHGIYFEDLRDLSDGVYIVGDTDQLTDTGSDIDALRKGHIYQLPNSIYQFIDFAAHESIEWYPLADSNSGWDDFDDWWEMPNYIEAPNLEKKSKGSEWDNNHYSRLIFHFEGVDSVVADFEGAYVHNYEAIDMENWWGKDLGWVAAFDGYDWTGTGGNNWGANLVGGPWVCEGWLYGGPEPRGSNTLQIETVVYGEDRIDSNCDGWQLSELIVHDEYNQDGIAISDPLIDVKRNTPICVDSNYETKLLPILDDPIASKYSPWKISAIHLMDLTSKLCAGMVDYFFRRVGISFGEYPVSKLIPFAQVVNGLTSYTDQYGKIYYGGTIENFRLTADQGRWLWDNSEHKYVFDPVGEGLAGFGYSMDGSPWSWIDVKPGVWTSEMMPYIQLPKDELAHTIDYKSINREGKSEPVNTLTFQLDKSRPAAEITFGEPMKKIVDGWGTTNYCITYDTPITITASDGDGSGIEGIYYAIYSNPGDEWVVGNDHMMNFDPDYENMPFEWGERYERPFNLGGYQVFQFAPDYMSTFLSEKWLSTPEIAYVPYNSDTVIFGDGITRSPLISDSWTGYFYNREYPLALKDSPIFEPGIYDIYFASQDNLVDSKGDTRWLSSMYPLGFARIKLLDSLDFVDVQISPYAMSVEPGTSFDFEVKITNKCPATQVFDLSVEGLNPNWFNFPHDNVILNPEETRTYSLTISIPFDGVILGAYSFSVTAKSTNDADVFKTTNAEFMVYFEPDVPSDPKGQIDVEVVPNKSYGEAGSQTCLEIRLRNNMNFDDTLRINLSVEDISDEDKLDLTWCEWAKLNVFLPKGGSSTIPLNVNIPSDAVTASKFFDVTALSASFSSALSSARGSVSTESNPWSYWWVYVIAGIAVCIILALLFYYFNRGKT